MTEPQRIKAVLEADQITCHPLGQTRFHPVSFTLSEGQLLLLSGQNGAGKTTLIRTLCGLSQPLSGKLRWRGEVLDQELHQNLQQYQEELCYLGHQTGIKPKLKVREQLTRFQACYSHSDSRTSVLSSTLFTMDDTMGNSAGDITGQDCLLNKIGLARQADQLTVRLSVGQKRRLAIARLILSRQKLWVLDEPFASLDKPGITLLQDLFKAHLDRQGIVLVTSHQALPIQPTMEIEIDADI